MKQLLSSTGSLICLEFPTHKLASDGGPPWSLPPNVHLELLTRPENCTSNDDSGKAIDADTIENGQTLARIAHYVPKRTQGMGIVDGIVRDCVSVWHYAP